MDIETARFLAQNILGLNDGELDAFIANEYGPKFTTADIVIDAKTIVESGRYYPGDVVIESDWDIDPTMAFLRIFEQKSRGITEQFRTSIIDNGIAYPITLCDIEQSDIDDGIVPRWMHPGIRVCDGHHRLQVAYEANLPVPVVFVSPERLREDYHNSPDVAVTGLPESDRNAGVE